MGQQFKPIRGWGLPFVAIGACAAVFVGGWLAVGHSGAAGSSGRSGQRGRASDLQAVIEAAETLRLQGESQKSEAVLREAVSKFSGEQDAFVALGELLVDKASRSIGGSDGSPTILEAYDCYQRALEIGPRSGDLEFVAGTLASQLGRWDRALTHYASARNADPNESRYALYLAQVQLRFNRLADAKANLLVSSKFEPEAAASWGTLAEIALRESDPQSALEYVSKARNAEPSKIVWRIIQSRALLSLRRPQDALDLLVGLDDDQKFDVGVLSVMSECYAALGQTDVAASLYGKAAGLKPADGELAISAARWLFRAGRKDEAKLNAERAAMLGVTGAREFLRELQGE